MIAFMPLVPICSQSKHIVKPVREELFFMRLKNSSKVNRITCRIINHLRLLVYIDGNNKLKLNAIQVLYLIYASRIKFHEREFEFLCQAHASRFDVIARLHRAEELNSQFIKIFL